MSFGVSVLARANFRGGVAVLVIQSNDPVKIKSPVSGTGQGLSPLIPHVLP